MAAAAGVEVLRGSCHCGAVEFEVDAQPTFSAICHCELCRKVNGASAVHVLGVPRPSLRITKGEASLTSYSANPTWTKRFCAVCGVPITQGPDAAPFHGTYPANYRCAASRFPELPDVFKPTAHINFENALIPDVFRPACAIPKIKTFPKSLGGCGTLME